MFKRAAIPWMVRLVLACILIGMGAVPFMLACAQVEEVRYFEETGHNVSGEFLRFYQENGGRAIFGYPLTSALDEKGLRVQYFQRARLELYFDASGTRRVQLGPLGLELGYRQPPLTPPHSVFNHPDKRYYPETGHIVSFAFLDFYEAHGGPALFGYPITEWVVESNGRIVQYFERGKLEWYPENPPGQRVQPGMLGVIYVEQYVDPIYTEREIGGGDLFARSGQDTSAPEPVAEPPTVVSPITEIQVLASVKYPIIGLQGTQTIYVYVLDQSGQGVEGASVEVKVQCQNDRVEQFVVENTDLNGYGRLAFAIGDLAPGYVMVASLHAHYRDLEARTFTAFLPWW
jgi:hypothetical protein